MELWEEHFSRERWQEMKQDPDFPMDKLLTFYKTAGNPESPVVQSVINLIESHLYDKDI